MFGHQIISHRLGRKILAKAGLLETAVRRFGCQRDVVVHPDGAFSVRDRILGDGLTVQAFCFLSSDGEGALGAVDFGADKLECFASFGSDGFRQVIGALTDQGGGAQQDFGALVGWRMCRIP